MEVPLSNRKIFFKKSVSNNVIITSAKRIYDTVGRILSHISSTAHDEKHANSDGPALKEL